MKNVKIIGLPVLVSARFRIVLDQGLCRMYDIPENGEVKIMVDDSVLLISPDMPDSGAVSKRVTIGRFNLPMQWVRDNQVKIGDYAYLMPTESGIQVKSAPWEAAI